MKSCIVKTKILLPNPSVDMEKWAVIACDQFTSQPEYWESLEKTIGEQPSSYHCTLPEVYLKQNVNSRIQNIQKSMNDYLKNGVFSELEEGFILVDRKTPFAEKRLGLVAAVDLETYSYIQSDKSLIRATEGTILDRIPPRVAIREGAPLEFPHIMLLLDDGDKTVIEPLYEKRNTFKKLYDFHLNMSGGHITGYHVTDFKDVFSALNQLISPKVLQKKYNSKEELLLVAGDGNHSLATAKTCWEKLKPTLTEKQKQNHPARFALCEIVNIHDEGLSFHPIHRALFDLDSEKFIQGLQNKIFEGNTVEAIMLQDGTQKTINLPQNTALCYKFVQDFIDGYFKENGGEVDYIHGDDALLSVCKGKNTIGLFMPTLNKNELFSYVLSHGSLPRKTFSMGEAVEKRYYIEAKRIF